MEYSYNELKERLKGEETVSTVYLEVIYETLMLSWSVCLLENNLDIEKAKNDFYINKLVNFSANVYFFMCLSFLLEILGDELIIQKEDKPSQGKRHTSEYDFTIERYNSFCREYSYCRKD